MHYLDFDVDIGPGSGGSYPVSVHSPGGQATGTLLLPFDEASLKERLKDLQIALLKASGDYRSYLSPEEQVVQGFGRDLFEALMAGEVGHCYIVSQQIANDRNDTGLRIRLHFLAPDLAALPWEYLYDPVAEDYLCLDRSTPLVRYLNLPKPIPRLKVTFPLRILGMIASPTDLPPLNAEREKARLQKALGSLEASGRVELHWMEQQTWEALHEAMLYQGPWHIFHFIGHGGFNAAAGEGALGLLNERGALKVLGAKMVAKLLSNQKSLRLAVLNACEGARGNEYDMFSSTAATLARQIPAVLAMQYAITDTAAIRLTAAFYKALTHGFPVDEAVVATRQAINVGLGNSLEWGTPVLYLRAQDGLLFDLQGQPNPPDSTPPKPPPAPTEVDPPPSQPATGGQSTGPVQAPQTAKAWRERGDAAYQSHQYTEALDAYSQAIQLEPLYGRAYASKGLIFRYLHRFEEALDAYNKALEINYHTAATYNGKGLALNALKRYQEAISAFDRAIDLERRFSGAYTAKGEALAGLGRYAEALSFYERALQLNPHDEQALFGEGRELLRLHRFDAALTVFETMIQASPKSRRAYLGKADALLAMSRAEEALAVYEHAIHLHFEDAHAQRGKGAALKALKRYRRALETYNFAIRLDYRNPLIFIEQGEVFEALAKHAPFWYDNALNAYDHAIELNPTLVAAYRHKAKLLEALKHTEEAQVAFEQALRLDSGNEEDKGGQQYLFIDMRYYGEMEGSR